jgi:heat shock protein HslJ
LIITFNQGNVFSNSLFLEIKNATKEIIDLPINKPNSVILVNKFEDIQISHIDFKVNKSDKIKTNYANNIQQKLFEFPNHLAVNKQDNFSIFFQEKSNQKALNLVSAHKLISLDVNNYQITSALTDKHFLSSSKQMSPNLTNTSWQLIEIMGKPVTRKDIYLHFQEDGKSINGFNGCNLFTGEYKEKNGYNLKFQLMFSTMRACLDGDYEQQFMELLAKVDNYAIANNILSLHQAKTAPLLRFVPREEK